MNVKTAVERSRKKRTFTLESHQGEKRITYWTHQDLHKLNELELEIRRSNAARLIAPFNEELSPFTQLALTEVLTLEGSREYLSVHGAMSTLMTALLQNGVAEELEACIAVYTAMYPNSLDYVLKTSPAKVLNYLCLYSNSTDVIKWSESEPDWKDRIIASLKNGTFRNELKRIRYATQSMTLNLPAMLMLEGLMNDVSGITPTSLEGLKAIQQEQAREALCLSPREWCLETNNVRNAILYLVLAEAENRWGRAANRDRTCLQPLYDLSRERAGQTGTGIITFAEGTEYAEQYDHGLCIGWRYDSWEQFFYQVCIGAVFLLNPKTTVSTTALEIGVAYKFAEEMLDKYLPHTSRRRLDSPAGTKNSYDQALGAVRKLSDDALCEIRKTFGSFGAVTDKDRFAGLTAGYLTPGESSMLCAMISPPDDY